VKTIREAKVAVAEKFLADLCQNIANGKLHFAKYGFLSPELEAKIDKAPLEIVELLENEEILQAERNHEADLENAYKR